MTLKDLAKRVTTTIAQPNRQAMIDNLNRGFQSVLNRDLSQRPGVQSIGSTFQRVMSAPPPRINMPLFSQPNRNPLLGIGQGIYNNAAASLNLNNARFRSQVQQAPTLADKSATRFSQATGLPKGFFTDTSNRVAHLDNNSVSNFAMNFGGLTSPLKSEQIYNKLNQPMTIARSKLTGKQLGMTNEQLIEQFGGIPKSFSRVKELDLDEAREQLTRAVMSEDRELPVFNKLFAQWIGERQAATTQALQKAKPFSNLGADEGWDLVRHIQGTKTSSNPRVQAKAAEFKQLTDQAFKEATDAGLDIKYLKGYITQLWKESESEIMEKMQSVGQNFKYAKRRVIPTYDEGIAMGLTPKFKNPGQIVASYLERLERTRSNIKFFNSLKRMGLVVDAPLARQTPGFKPIVGPGFPQSSTQGYFGTVNESFYAPSQIADQINKIFAPESMTGVGKALNLTGKASGLAQDISLSGGLPGTPLNAFSFAQVLKEVLSGRITSPVAATLRSLAPGASKKFFSDNADQITKMQKANIPVYTNHTIESLAPMELKEALAPGNLWNKTMSDPTFKKLMPMLQINLFNDIEKQALKKGMSSDEAAKVAAKAVKNFYGIITSDKTAKASQIGQDLAKTTLFAPKYRESMINFWINNLKALKNPLAAENITNTRFIVGAVLTYVGYDKLNQHFNGHPMSQNPDNKKDKLLIPLRKLGIDSDVVVGIPYLSSIATIPRGIYRQAGMLKEGDITGTAKDALSTYSSSLVRPFADIVRNENYFGQPISNDAGTGREQNAQRAAYLAKSFMHPYMREGLNIASERLPIDDETKRLLGIKTEPTPLWQSASMALEAPLRFYTQDSIDGSRYFDNQKKALKGIESDDRAAYALLHPTKNPFTQEDKPKTVEEKMFKVAIRAKNPGVYLVEKQIAQDTAKQTGKPLDPLYSPYINLEQAQRYFRYQSLPPGSQDGKDMLKAYPEVLTLIEARAAFFEANPIESDVASAYDTKPEPSPRAQYMMDQKQWDDPEVRDYLDKNREWNNQQRALLGLPELEGYDWYTKKGKKVTVKKAKSTAYTIKAPKIKSAKAIKAPKLKATKPKSLLDIPTSMTSYRPSKTSTTVKFEAKPSRRVTGIKT